MKFRNIKLITASADELNPRPDALYLPEAANVSWTNQDDSTVATVSLVAGYHNFSPKKITAGTGVYGCYEEMIPTAIPQP